MIVSYSDNEIVQTPPIIEQNRPGLQVDAMAK